MKNRESGQALLMVLAMLALGSLIVIPVVALSGTSVEYHRVVEKNTLETYSAEAGVEYALCKLGNDPNSYKVDPLEHSFIVNEKTVDVATEYMGGGIFKITSIATTDIDSSTTIESYVYIGKGDSSFDNAITALDGDIDLTGNIEVTSFPDWGEGDIYANGDINITGNATIDGDATATGNINKSGNVNITGIETPQADPITFEEVDPLPYLQEADQGDLIHGDLKITGNGTYYLGPTHITGDLKISGNRTVKLEGTVYVDGEVTMTGNTRIEGPGTVVAVGNMKITGNTRLDPDEIPVIFSTTGEIEVHGNSWSSVVLYAPNDEIRLTGNSKVYGSIVGKEVTMTGNSKVDYPVDLRDRDDLPDDASPILDIMTWQIS